jgi:hypothetical protein
MSGGKISGTLNLGLAKETLSTFTPWQDSSGSSGRPGGEFGCDLVKGTDGKIHISRIADAGPAALSGLIANGDELLAIDGQSIAGWVDTGFKLNELTAGGEGTAVWIEIQSCGVVAAPPQTLCLIRQKPLDANGWTWSKVASSASSIKSSLALPKVGVPTLAAPLPSSQRSTIEELGIEIELTPENQIVVAKVLLLS